MDHKPTNNKTRPNQTFQNQNHPTITFQENFLNIQNNFPDHHHIYTDGSKQGLKVGCAAVFQNQELLKHLPNESSIYSVEVIAIDLAMNIIANHESFKFIIYSDSKSVLQALQSKDSTPLITRLLDKMNTLSKNNCIILTWIPSLTYGQTLVCYKDYQSSLRVSERLTVGLCFVVKITSQAFLTRRA